MRDAAFVLIDGDDTIWYDRRYFTIFYRRIRQLVGGSNSERLSLAAKAALPGEFGFVAAIRDLLGSLSLQGEEEGEHAIKEFLAHPLEILPGAESVLLALRGRAGLVLYTSGIEKEQKGKIARSGLGDLFHACVIVDSKTEDSLRNLISSLGALPDSTILIGNSLKNDILPAEGLGIRAVWLNHSENTYGRDSIRPEGVLEIAGWDELISVWELGS